MKKNILFALMPVAVALFIWACGESDIIKDFGDMSAEAIAAKCANNLNDPICASGTPSPSSGSGIGSGVLDGVIASVSCPGWSNWGTDGLLLYEGDNISTAAPTCILDFESEEDKQLIDSLECETEIKLYVLENATDPYGVEISSSVLSPLEIGKFIWVTAYAKCTNSTLNSNRLVYRVQKNEVTIDGNCIFSNAGGEVPNPMKRTAALAAGDQPYPDLTVVSGSDFECEINGRSINNQPLTSDDYVVTYTPGNAGDFPGPYPASATGTTYTYTTKSIDCTKNGTSLPSITRACKLVVNDGSCQANETKVQNDFCGEMDVQYKIPTGGDLGPIGGNGAGTKGCYFVKSFDQIAVGQNSSFKVNGVTCSCSNKVEGTDCGNRVTTACTEASQKPINGGYYIQTIRRDWDGAFTNGGVAADGAPACFTNNPVCNLSSLPKMEAGVAYDMNANKNTFVKCGSGASAKNTEALTNWTGIDWANPTIGTKNEIKVTATCNGVAEEATCSGTPITVYPKPSDITTKLSWTNVRNNSGAVQATGTKDGIFYRGEVPTRTDVTVKAEVCDGAIFYEPATLNATTTANAGQLSVVAKCKLSGSEEEIELDEITATVVPNPSLKGACEWDAKGNKYGGGTMANVNAVPSIEDRYGRTCEGPYFTQDGNKQTNVSAGLTVPTQGNYNLPTGVTWNNLKIKTTCEGVSGTIADISCPNILIWDPDQMCEYEFEKADWCGNIPIENVIKTGRNSDGACEHAEGCGNGDKCYYFTSATNIALGNGAKINGKDANEFICGSVYGNDYGVCNNKLDEFVGKEDGGYYVYITGHTNALKITNSYAPNLHPNCR